MSSSTRSLFRAAASERKAAGSSGIQDPFASYNPSTGALRCSACNYLAIKHESLWASHASSKSHRTNAARIKAERERQDEALLARQSANHEGKRKADDDGYGQPTERGQGTGEGDSKRAKVDTETAAGDAGAEDIDPEWEAFQREIAEAEASATQAADPVQAQYASATIEVEPVIKGRGADAAAAAGTADGEGGEGQDGQPAEEETEEERRARREQEEREEIYSRYEEEQRIQDEAEERVSALKAKLERLKAARLAKKQKQPPQQVRDGDKKREEEAA
ncbi:uncharacterized protein PFL1_03677 [Pseudozyma flocculosa PF-1]|uniref:Zinc finger protein 830 n=2 Tax=Pseudozyma flocculosa TaxID=84751 RepID=A0A5C3F499_9BASI|nr:uncharacterized protein PFL1_03677 [Pseudozyma flocculosa PF-1]EPQ28875.1 hypothetical protein PFL1_03677 [Pseudozyma flocculosa PF-1]SPO39333.1 uncharacterized protein PSFLO_04814 [Pseudozyma flocculosa]